MKPGLKSTELWFSIISFCVGAILSAIGAEGGIGQIVICCQIERGYRTSPGRCGPRNRKKGLSGALAQGFAKASALPQDSVNLMLGALVDPAGTRGVANLDVNISRDVLAFASGEFASANDWQAMAGLKMRF